MNKNKPNSDLLIETGANLDNRKLEFQWDKAEKIVNRLQSRIAKAAITNNKNLVKKLQYLLINNYYAKALSVKIVTDSWHSDIAGIDNVIWDNNLKKMSAINKFNEDKYTCNKLKKVNIYKYNGELTEFLIPAMNDRAKQVLYSLVLKPIAKNTIDYSFNLNTKIKTIRYIRKHIFYLLKENKNLKWTYQIELSKLIKEENYESILKNIFIDNKILRIFLSLGYLNEDIYEEDLGALSLETLSSIIIDIIIQDLDLVLREKLLKVNLNNENGFAIFRYYKKIIVLSEKTISMENLNSIINTYFKSNGLNYYKLNINCKSIDYGFDFLGWNYKRYYNTLRVSLSDKAKKDILESIRTFISNNKAISQEKLIQKLNKIIKRKKYVYDGKIISRRAFQDIDNNIYHSLWNWAIRRHGKQSKQKIKEKYWKKINGESLVFCKDKNILIKLSENNY